MNESGSLDALCAADEVDRMLPGGDLFGYLLDPPLLYGERDTSEDNAFG